MADFKKNKRKGKNKKKKGNKHNHHELMFSQALEGYQLHAEARKLSYHTLQDYFRTFNRFYTFLGGDIPINSITANNIEQFIASLKGLSKKTICNYHTGLSALWTWAVNNEFVHKHVVRAVIPPKPTQKEIIPFSEQEVKLMLYACQRSRSYSRPSQIGKFNHLLSNRERNRSIILMLLDTGLRASELCSLKIGDIDKANQRIIVTGKGDKERSVYLSRRTLSVNWRYLATRPGFRDTEAFVVSSSNQPLKRGGLRQLINRIGQRAGVKNAHPHRFRHTFAINFLRNGGNIYVLQEILGHSTLEMVRRYLKIAERDLANCHRSASPVENWNL